MNRLAVLLTTLAVTVAAASAQPRRGDFPDYGIIPKEDTGALRFLHEHPAYDGRGVTVAIFDTGVDPGAPGLQTTTTGAPKIVDIIDGSGSGDVRLQPADPTDDGRLEGLSGRMLTIDPDWNNPTGEYRIGLKRAYELYPGGLISRLKEKRREKWDERQRAAVTALKRELAEWDVAHPKPDEEQKKQREELETRLAQLERLQKEYDDPGPIFDCVVFHDGEVWRAVIDTDEDGDLRDEDALTNYRIERQYDTFGDEDLMNYAVNIYEDGDLLSIVCDAGMHGTHVAGIVAAHFPEQPELNGLAPGAQLVAVKIGDTRLGSNSTGTGEIRGCIAVLENNCDLINMSYGGPSPDPDDGHTPQLYSELVNKHGVIFVASAGNNGPALSTNGSPGATTEAIFGIGAYYSPEMLAVQYSARYVHPANQYTFSSRGPTSDGAVGVKFSAPGGAIAPVPNWTLQGSQQAHGTSMSSPNACGNIALLLSGLKAEGIPFTPARVRRAIENTAAGVPGLGTLQLGEGLMQIDKAFDYLREHHDAPYNDVRFDVRVTTRDNARGIYLREPFELDRVCDARVVVKPIFPEDADNRAKVDFELRCRLEPTARWIECADYYLLPHGGRRLDVRVDPTRLDEGAHYAEIRAYDAAAPERGPVFRIPVTVIIPGELDQEDPAWRAELPFAPGHVERHFMVVPEGATWADLRVHRTDEDGDLAVIVCQTVQLVPSYAFSDHQFKRYMRLAAQTEEVYSFPVVGGRTLEIDFAEYTAYLSEGQLDVALTFHGIVPDREVVALEGGQNATRVNVASPLRKERVSPAGSLDVRREVLRPSDSVLRPLDNQRDRLWDERQIYELVLTYDFSLVDGGTVTPRAALTEISEYNESFQSQMFMVFDEGRQLLATGNDDPGPVKLAKGDYTVRFHVRHDDASLLENLEGMPLFLDHKLSSPVRLSFHDDPDGALDGRDKFGTRWLAAGERAALWIAGPGADDLPKQAAPGDLLLGSLTYGQGDASIEGEGHRPGGYPVALTVPPKPTATKDTDGVFGDEEERNAADKLAEAVRDLKVTRLGELHDEEHRSLFNRIAAEVLADYPNHLPVLVEQLRRADKHREEDPQAVVDAADRVLAQIDQDALAAHFGVKLDPDDRAANKQRKEMEKKKDALVEALHLKARALFDIATQRSDGGRPVTDAQAADYEAFEATFAEMQRWADTTDGDYYKLHIRRERLHDRPGNALKLINDKIEDEPTQRELYETRLELIEALGWPHWQDYEQRWQLIRFRPHYPPF